MNRSASAGVLLCFLLLPGVVPARPRLLLNQADFARIEALAAREPWAAAARLAVIGVAEAWPQSHLTRFGLSALELPPEGGQWTHHYVCPTHGVRLEYRAPNTHRCTVDGRTFTGWPYDQVIFTQRHSDLADAARDLGLAYRLTGRQEFADAAAWILRQYGDRYLSYALHDTQGRFTKSAGRVLAQTLDESIWLISAAWAYDLVSDSGALSAEERQKIERDLLRAAAATVLNYDAGQSNWQSWHNAALAAVGFTLGDTQLSGRAIDGASGFRYQMDRSVIDEGFWYEGAWGYHFYALDALTRTAEMAARNGVDLWGTEPALAALFSVPLRLMFADGSLPAFNDSATLSLHNQDSLYEVAYARTRDAKLAGVLGRRARGRNALFWGAADLPRGDPPRLASETFEKAGYAVLRAPGNDHAVLLKFGPHGGGHGHYDKLGIISFARGGILGLDPGTQSYAAPTHDSWDKMTVAHNTLVVDEKRQDEAEGRLLWSRSGPGFSAASADAGPAYRNAALSRTLMVTDDYALEVSEARSTDGASHTFDWIYHNSGAASTDLPLSPWSGFGAANGYQHLTGNRSAVAAGDWRLRFDGTPSPLPSYGSVWASNTAVSGRFDISRDQAAGGNFCGKAAYEIGGSGYLLFTTPALSGIPEGKPAALRIMIFGDGSGYRLSLRLNDATDERFVAAIGPIDWRGWKAIEVKEPEKWTHFLGNNDGVFDGPVRTAGIQLDYAAGGPAAGALYVDDIVLDYGNGIAAKIADFEITLRNLRAWTLGEPDTRVVAGNGLGPDLLKPVPYVLARRVGRTARFVVLLEPYGPQPAVSGFREVQQGVFEIRGPTWTDRVDLSVIPISYHRTAHRIIPRLADSPREWTGIALLNAGSQAAEIACTAFDDRGNLIQGSNVVNPSTFTLQPGEQRARLASEIFGFSPVGTAEQSGWIRATSSQPDILSFFLFGDSRGSWLDGADAPMALSTDFVFTKIPRRPGLEYSTEFSFVNPADSSADLSLEIYDSGGGRRGARSFTIPARGRLRVELPSLFDTSGFVPGWIRGRAGTGLAAFELFRGLGSSGAGGETMHAGGLNALETDAAAAKLYGAHLIVGGGWFTEFALVNPEATPAIVEMRAFDNDGIPMAGTSDAARSFEIPAGGSLNLSGVDLFGLSTTARREGYAEITVRSGPGILGSITFGTDDNLALASLPLQAGGSKNYIIPHVSQGLEWFTGVALMNPSAALVPVTLTVYDSAGRRVGARVVEMKPRGKQARVLSEWVPESDLQQGGQISVSAPEAILCFGLFGSRDLRRISAIPAQ